MTTNVVNLILMRSQDSFDNVSFHSHHELQQWLPTQAEWEQQEEQDKTVLIFLISDFTFKRYLRILLYQASKKMIKITCLLQTSTTGSPSVLAPRGPLCFVENEHL